jgi:DNA-binding PadR family transcriptional regulator
MQRHGHRAFHALMRDEARHEHRHRHRGFGRHGFGRGDLFGGRKAHRGDIRAAILALLQEQPMHGYQIMREVAERSQGAWEPSAGSVYPALQQLEDEGLVRASAADGRRVFELTDEGRAEAARRGGPAPWERPGDGGEAGDLRALTFGIMGALRQIAFEADPERIARAEEILRDARRQLYQLLADDEPREGAK